MTRGDFDTFSDWFNVNPPTEEMPKHKMHRHRSWPWVIAILVLLLGMGVSVFYLTHQPAQPVSVPTVPASPDATGIRTEFGPGTWLVGTHILPGAYRTDGSHQARGRCYWARLNTLEGNKNNVNADRFAEGASIVTVQQSDVALEVMGDCIWRKVR